MMVGMKIVLEDEDGNWYEYHNNGNITVYERFDHMGEARRQKELEEERLIAAPPRIRTESELDGDEDDMMFDRICGGIAVCINKYNESWEFIGEPDIIGKWLGVWNGKHFLPVQEPVWSTC